MGNVWVILKKTFSIALIFNSLISIACVAGIIYGYYMAYPYWKPYSPFLLDGNLFWLALAAGIINIFQAPQSVEHCILDVSYSTTTSTDSSS
jgi:hypothetical protein